ncbi:MAG: bactofilin family protein [Brevinema sp.]
MSKEFVANSLVGDGAVFEGKFHVAGSFRLDGQFDGELTVEEHLFISPVGRLKTDTVYTKTIAVAGIFIGNIEASQEVQLLSTGRVLGNIRSPKLLMEPGVVVQGQIDITGTGGINIKESIAETNQHTVLKKTSKNNADFEETV